MSEPGGEEELTAGGYMLPESATAGTTRDERAATWGGMNDDLPGLLDLLLKSDVYGRQIKGRPAAPKTHGVYLFSEVEYDERRHLYVGRTGRTERSEKSGKPSSSGFRARLGGHSRPKSSMNSASFAVRLAMEEAAEKGLELPAKRADRMKNDEFVTLFVAAKGRITEMEFRAVRIDDPRASAVFEVYAAFVLATPYNSFATS